MRRPRWLALLALAAVSLLRAGQPAPDAVVATDGTGRYASIQDAVSSAPMSLGRPWLILVRKGVYRERVYVQRERGNIILQGEDRDGTVLVYNLNANLKGPDGKPIGTFRTPTLQVDGDGFTVRDMTISNDAGPVGQALAVRVDGERVAFYRCTLLGWQDTLLVNRGRQYFSDCRIQGHVDFIFGGATAYFDHCRIHCVGDGYITAASTPKGTPFGMVFADCSISGDGGVRTYLGRPWRDFAAVAFVRTDMTEVVRREGWHDWNKPQAHDSARFAEFGSTGPGAAGPRVPWARTLTPAEASALNPQAVLGGPDHWQPDANGEVFPGSPTPRR
jgi:pectinesterase